ncbi:hypothetical protein Peur_021509 [Populus x canadensis]
MESNGKGCLLTANHFPSKLVKLILVNQEQMVSMFKVPTIQFRCHRSGFCQNQAIVNQAIESSSLPAFGNHLDSMKTSRNIEEMHDQKKKDVCGPSLLDMETGCLGHWRD